MTLRLLDFWRKKKINLGKKNRTRSTRFYFSKPYAGEGHRHIGEILQSFLVTAFVYISIG